MKRLIFTTVITLALTTITHNGNAQNSLDLKWGYVIPLNKVFGKTFSNKNAFGIGITQAIDNSRVLIGFYFSHEQFQSKNDFFKDNYRANFYVHNYLASVRYDILRNEEFNIYTSVDVGLAKYRNEETKNNISTTTRNAGISTGFALGTDLKLTGRTKINLQVQSRTHLADLISFDDQLTVKNLETLEFNIGFRFLLRKR